MSCSINNFLNLVEVYCTAAGVAEKTASHRLFGRNTKIDDLRAGKDVGVLTLERAMQWLSDSWPEGAVWPQDVARPAPSLEAVND